MHRTHTGRKPLVKTGRIVGNSRGTLLMLTIMILMLLIIIMAGVLTVTANALHLGRFQRSHVSAFNVAESGAEVGVLWLRAQPYPPVQISPFDPLGGPQTLSDGSYSIVIYPHADNTTEYLKTYRVVSVGTVGASTRTVELVVRQASFGRYAYFTDSETSSITGGAIWWRAGEICDGPIHSNNTGGSDFQINYVNSNSPIFLDMLTASGSSINYNPSRPTNEATFRRIFADGSKGFQLGVPRIDLPVSSDVQKNAAWGSSSGFPSTNGVHLRSPNDGGIYIRGDCTIEMSVQGNTTQRIDIRQGTALTRITVNLVHGTSTMTRPNGTTVSGGLPNGVIYCTGNITSLKGTIADNRAIGNAIHTRSNWTIATDVAANKNITISDDLVYRTRPDKNRPDNHQHNLAAGTLGLVAKDVVIASNAPRNLEINAVVMSGGRNTAGGSFYVSNYNSKSPTGTLSVLGGIIQKARGPVGTFNPSTGQMLSGYEKNYSYDPRLALHPPPFFPTTGSYERLSWRLLAN